MTTLCVPGLLLNGEWLPPMRSHNGRATSLADVILSASGHLFPNHFASEFELTLAQNLEDPVSADLALVSKDLQAWYLLFIEPSRNADVESLIARLQIAKLHQFGVREAGELKRHIDGLDPAQLRLLVYESPTLVVITDDPRQYWRDKLAAAGIDVDVMTVEPFSYGDSYVIRVNGDNPVRANNSVIGTCVGHPTFASCLLVTWYDSSRIPQLGVITLKYGDLDSEWELLQGGSSWQLHARGSFPVSESPPFDIVASTDGSLLIRKSST